MSFNIVRFSTDIPDTVFVGLDNATCQAWRCFDLLPPDNDTKIGKGSAYIWNDKYYTKVTIVDSNGRTAILAFAGFGLGASLGIKGNITGGERMLQTTDGKWGLFSPKRKIGLHLRKDGCWEVRAIEKVVWSVEGKEMEVVVLELPAFRGGDVPAPAYSKS